MSISSIIQAVRKGLGKLTDLLNEGRKRQWWKRGIKDLGQGTSNKAPDKASDRRVR